MKVRTTNDPLTNRKLFIIIKYSKIIRTMVIAVSRLMGSSAAGVNMNVNMSVNVGMGQTGMTLGGCNPTDPTGHCKMGPGVQFPLTQRRKRRVLFTQAQVLENFLNN